jgi:hypothetical protein
MSKAPNILLITTDQQRFDTAGEAAPSSCWVMSSCKRRSRIRGPRYSITKIPP